MIKEDYSKLKERSGHRGEYRHFTTEPTWEIREPRRIRHQYVGLHAHVRTGVQCRPKPLPAPVTRLPIGALGAGPKS